MTVQERVELTALIQQLLPTLADHALHALSLACVALSHSADEDAETPRETFDGVLDMLNEPNTRALGTIACAVANVQGAAQSSEDETIRDLADRVRRAQ